MTEAILLALALVAGAPPRRLGPVTLVLVVPWMAVAVLLVAVVRSRPRASIDPGLAAATGVAAELRAGRSLRASLGSALGTDPTTPLGRAGRRAVLGLEMSTVAEDLRTGFGRHGHLMAASLEIVERLGSSGAAAMDTVAALVRADHDLARERRSATAPARVSAIVMTVAPLGFLAWQVADGAVRRALTVPGGAFLLIVGATLTAGGLLVVHALARGVR